MEENFVIEDNVLIGLYQHGEGYAIDLEGYMSVALFKKDFNQILYKILAHAIAQKLDIDYPAIVACANDLKLTKYLEDNKSELDKVLNAPPMTINNAIIYGKEAYKLRLIRRTKELFSECQYKLRDFNEKVSADDIVEIAERPGYAILEELQEGKDDKPVNLGEYSLDFVQERIDNPIKMVGLPTPFPKFNHAIGGGLRKGGITLVGAPSGNGKSLFSKEVAYFLSKSIPVLYIDTEMDKEEQITRTLSSMTGVEIDKIETGQMTPKEQQIVKKACVDLKKQQFYHRGVGGMEFDSIISIIKRWIHQHVGVGVDGKCNDCLVIYDYFKLMSQKEVDHIAEYEAIGYNASKLTDFTKTLHFPVLAFVQLNRKNDIAQSQRLEWFAKSVNFLYKKTEDEIKECPTAGNGKLYTNIGKQRYNHNAMSSGDYINLFVDPSKSTMVEGMTYYESLKEIEANGFDVEDFDDDEDFDGFN